MKMSSINIRMDSNLTGMWVNFFTTAGIPSDVAATYALTFAENRIQNDMLLDLNKEYLRDMGITRMGDVIAILRHAKIVHESTARDKVLSTTLVNKVPVAAVTGRSTNSQPSSPATRILEHYTRNTAQEPPKTTPPKRKLTDIGNNTSEAEIKRSRLIRFGDKSQVAVKEGPSTKQTVFARLGSADIQKPAPSVKPEVRPIFSRLGSKQHAHLEVPVPKDALKYEGILKSPLVLKKTVTVTTTKNNVRRIATECTMRADEEPVSVKEKIGLPTAKISLPDAAKQAASKSVKFAKRVEYKEIEAIKKTVNLKPKFTPVFNKPERRLSMPEVTDVKARLGTVKNISTVKKPNNLTITRNVFNRLGV